MARRAGKAFSIAICVFAAGFALAACAPVIAPLGTGNDIPALDNDTFLTRDGLNLPLRHWDAGHPGVIIVALHGMSDYSNAFDMPAAWWAEQDITTYAYDQRGFGRAPHTGLWPGAKALREDFADCLATVRARHPGVPVFALGESMGGAVVLSALAEENPPRPDGVILVAPAVWSRGDMPIPYSLMLWLTAHTMPWLELSGKGLKIWPSDNIEMLKKLSRDPLFQKRTRADAVWGLVDLMGAAHQAAAKLKSPPPILLLYGAKDQIIPRQPTEAVAKELDDRAEVREYAGGYHMLLRDLDGPSIWKDVAAWVKAAPR